MYVLALSAVQDSKSQGKVYLQVWQLVLNISKGRMGRVFGNWAVLTASWKTDDDMTTDARILLYIYDILLT